MYWVDETIIYNINYGNNKSEEEIKSLIKYFGVEDMLNIGGSNVGNTNRKVGINGDKLSGGQKQIIHLLRALLSTNKIIILDEPTSSIDREHKILIKKLISNISKDRTLLLISHDKEMIDLVNKQIKL